ncbi:aromatic acid exporter family protein [Proteiniborus sp. MB09-C3]|uniref:FUSC family protein n=1 Tax=Proteiniborus sp. MB09-C3 TaxID=3050072 RepID=UPI0025552CBC|nr:aromatic acid exporter family protein [Proteiniborus sp. MB09-C3]WIV12015.1 aromatic acid exporter family protein [Proteiniborus sp. MB09-C3]
MKIGMRTIKTSIAVTIGITLAYILKLNSPFFVGVAAIIAMQGNLVDSYRMGRDRVLGTILGAAVGLLGSFISIGNPIIIGIGIIIIISLCNKLGWSKSISIATIVFISIIISVEKGQELSYSLNRILDTIVGIIVAVIVNFVISPPLAKDKIYSESLNIIDEFSRALKAIIIKEEPGKKKEHLADIEDKLDVIDKEYPILIKEINIKLYKRSLGDVNLQHSRILLKKLYYNLNLLAEMGSGFNLSPENSSIVNNKYNLNIVGTDNLTDLDIVYNYHLKTSLGVLQELRGMFKL